MDERQLLLSTVFEVCSVIRILMLGVFMLLNMSVGSAIELVGGVLIFSPQYSNSCMRTLL